MSSCAHRSCASAITTRYARARERPRIGTRAGSSARMGA
ncbi:hypothetical protein STRAU_4523 [Streptomyces aurantiacus JA 4570]|uniref:Uncharacterized protein n=1 Tax=Streptomyces aurantiacus JA 4570 TaxID=1286094 RepID=S3ZVG5_9ACTN|nr:hypothetical protein STRAU_4523 [Streptomyces aurantiacus JA 4570]